jgi:chloramphenicol 3-O-phosphotransferase
MSKIIILNCGSCSGKSTIAKEICRQSGDKFVHLQVDKVGDFYGTIFPNGFQFVANEVGTENHDHGLKGLFNKNRFARRRVVAGILLSTAIEVAEKDFNIVIDTSLDGPDAKDLANLYLDRLAKYNSTFIGIKCSLEERLKRLKTRTDNLFLTEEFIKMQEGLMESLSDFYDLEIDVSNIDGKFLATKILEQCSLK